MRTAVFFALFVSIATAVVVYSSPHRAQTAFPGDNALIAYTSIDGDSGNILATDFTGGFDGAYTIGPGYKYDAAFSADGRAMAYAAVADGSLEIWALDLTMLFPTPMRITTDDASDQLPAWSPDGTQIVFASDRDGDEELWVMNADGSNPTPLTDNPAADSDPAWSPDGQSIAFTSDRSGNEDVWVMPAGGGAATKMTNNPGSDRDPEWSPDGTMIAFTSDRGDGDDIYLTAFPIPASAPSGVGGVTRLTNDPADDRHPAWSPDGTMIAFSSDRDGNSELYVMNADGSGKNRITNRPEAFDFQPDWGANLPASPTPTATAGPSGTPFGPPVTATPAPGLSGDVDCDGDVDAVDAQKLLQWKAAIISDPPCLHLGDVDCDGDKDAVDALKILQWKAGIAVVLPPGCPDIGTPV